MLHFMELWNACRYTCECTYLISLLTVKTKLEINGMPYDDNLHRRHFLLHIIIGQYAPIQPTQLIKNEGKTSASA